ncbi:MAG: NPCBM/NEW2 domain-containing protein [Planctomycetota bacterium]|jgi:hypothetical protein
MRVAAVALLVAGPALAGPRASAPVPLRDLGVRFVRSVDGRLYRSRTARVAGLFVSGERYRGLCSKVPARIGFDVDGTFARLVVRVGVLDGGREPVRFRVLGDGRPLASTPPLFAGAKPLPLEVALDGVILLELVAEGAGPAHAAWLDGRLFGAPGKDLSRFRAEAVPFSPEAYLPSFKRRVNQAIDKAVGYLLLHQRGDGTWVSGYKRTPGTTALATLAVLKGGIKGRDPSIVRAFEYLRQYRYDHVYTVACLLMALEARYFPRGAEPRRAVKEIPPDDQVWIRAAAEWLIDQRGAGFPKKQRDQHPVWRYPAGGYDLSNTQYALFGLAAARRCGVPATKVWLPALRYVLAAQEGDGPAVSVSRYFRSGDFERRRTERAKARGFGYALKSRPTGSMTSAGLCSLILCRAALRGRQNFEINWSGRTRAGIRDALAWLEEYYDLDVNPFRGRVWWEYYLFNIERVGVLLDQRYLGVHDWYREGAEKLMAVQGFDGCIGGNIVNTAFALLFLKRATVPPLTQGR